MKLIPDLEGDIFLKVPLLSLLHEKNNTLIKQMQKLILILINPCIKNNLFILT
jgi:hypothetical protein